MYSLNTHKCGEVLFSEKNERQLLRQSEVGSHLLLNVEMTFLVNNEVSRRSQYGADGV